MDKDTHFIKRTFQLAKKAEGQTSPNPMVGAVIVKNGKIIASGYHHRAGLAHAEIEAIKKAKGNIQGATLYVNLEPCCHFGRTGPCVDEVIKRGIKRVVIAACDPNPQVYKKSVKKLKAAGIKVKLGLMQEEARVLNEVFFKNMEKKMPFVAVKLAQSLDGKIATIGGESQWITSEKSRLFAKSLRDKHDCVLVGINTVLKDNPRLSGLKKIPYKAVIDPNLRIVANANLIKNNPEKLIIFAANNAKSGHKNIPASVKVFFLKKTKGILPLQNILKILYNLGITSMFVEGGSETIGRFFDAKLVDKIYFFIAPKIIAGKKSLSSIGGEGFTLSSCPKIKNIFLKYIGEDLLICGYPDYGKK